MSPFKNTSKQERVFIIATLCLLALIAFGGRSIDAQESSYLIYGRERAENSVRTYLTQDNKVAYCFDANLMTLNSSGQEYANEPMYADNESSYIMLHSYPVTTRIANQQYTVEEAQLITQVAVWMHQGFINEDGTMNPKAGDMFEDEIGIVPDFIAPHGEKILSPARKLVMEARNKGSNIQLPEGLRSKLYIPKDSSYQRMLVPPDRTWGRLKLIKDIDLPEELLSHSDYDVSKIVFEVYKDGQPTGKAFVLKKDVRTASGYTGFDRDNLSNDYIDLDPGTYEIKETSLPAGIKGIDTQKTVEVGIFSDSESIATVVIANEPKYIEFETLLMKYYTAGSDKVPLKDVEFEVIHKTDTETRSWILASDEQGLVKIDEEHYISGDPLYNLGKKGRLPLGELSVQEVKSPKIFELDDRVHTIDLRTDLGASDQALPLLVRNVHKRSDLRFRKIDGKTSQGLSYIPFRLTNTTTNETHIIFTDTNGIYDSSKVKHSLNTNKNDEFSEDNLLNSSLDSIDTQCGTWFYGVSNDDINDAKGALTPGTYRLQELPSKTNRDYALLDITFDIEGEKEIDLGNLTNWKIGLLSKLSVTNQTGKEVTLVDELSYTNLEKDTEYKIITSFAVLDADGNVSMLNVDDVQFTQETTYKPSDSDGILPIEIKLNKDLVKGKRLVAYEKILKDGEVICSHEIPHDKKQMAVFDDDIPTKKLHQTGIPQNMYLGFIALGTLIVYLLIRRRIDRDVW